MLITVSGLVGSGKTTAVTRIMDTLGASGVHWRFRSLPCFAWSRRKPRAAPASAPSSPRRWSGYRQKCLTASAAFGLALRTLAFRAFLWRNGRGVRVCSRYFYDNLVHYELCTGLERFYASLLRRLIPVPDLAILLVADLATIQERRPQYSLEYLASCDAAYRRLKQLFPELIEVRTDLGAGGLAHLERMVRAELLAVSAAAPREIGI